MLTTYAGLARLGELGVDGLTAPHIILLARNQTVPALTVEDVADVSEYSGGGYTGGFGGASRQVLGSLTSTVDEANGRTEIDAADVSFTGVTGPAAIAPCVAWIDEVTDDANSTVIAFLPLRIGAIDVTAASEDDPAVITTDGDHGLSTGDLVYIEGFAGGTWGDQLNGKHFNVTVVDGNEFSLDGVDSGSFGTATFATAKVYRPLAMNGAAVNAQWNAEGLVHYVPQVGAVTS